jgi:hypothetical protein
LWAGIHYIPVKTNLEDLIEKINWGKTHDNEAREIGQAARKFAISHLTLKDHLVYLSLLIEKYSGCLVE